VAARATRLIRMRDGVVVSDTRKGRDVQQPAEIAASEPQPSGPEA
jgi:hypothetical protein